MNLSLIKKNKTRSITRMLSVRLIITVLIVSAIAVTATFYVLSKAVVRGVEQKSDETLAYLVGTLEMPLWTVADDEVKIIGKAVCHDESIARLIIRNEFGDVIFAMEKENNNSLINRSGKIFHSQGNIQSIVGDVSVSLSQRIYMMGNLRLLFLSMLIIFLILISVAVVTVVSIRSFLNKPLKSLNEITDRFASGKYEISSDDALPYLEFKPFGMALADMAEKIEGQIKMVRKAEEDIRMLNIELEDRVIERTADLNLKTVELEHANVRLKELDRLKTMFIASMSHELRTPLNSIIGFSSILLNEWAGPVNTEQKENLTAILRSGKHLLMLVNDVIDVSKIESGIIESFPEELDLYDVMYNAVETFRNDIEKKGIELNLQAIHQPIHTDRRRLLQCLMNIISNAVKFTENGSIDVYAEITHDGDTVEISTSDTGIGIKEEDIQKLFSPFNRLDSPLRSTVLGTGLGLYLTKKLTIEILKGDVTVSSIYGKGSRFTLTLPANGVRRNDAGSSYN